VRKPIKFGSDLVERLAVARADRFLSVLCQGFKWLDALIVEVLFAIVMMKEEGTKLPSGASLGDLNSL
jgi:hypothetical protein